MVRCSVLGCQSDGEKKLPELSFHSFPQDDNLRIQKWIDATGRPNWIPKKYSKICSRHFMPNRIIKKKQRTLLLPNALPILESHLNVEESKDLDDVAIKTEVDDPLHLGSEVVHITDPNPGPSCESAILNNGDTEITNEHQTISGVQETNLSKYTPRALERKLIRAQQQSADRLKKLKTFREKCRRLTKKVADMQNMIAELKGNSVISKENGVLLETIDPVNNIFFKNPYDGIGEEATPDPQRAQGEAQSTVENTVFTISSTVKTEPDPDPLSEKLPCPSLAHVTSDTLTTVKSEPEDDESQHLDAAQSLDKFNIQLYRGEPVLVSNVASDVKVVNVASDVRLVNVASDVKAANMAGEFRIIQVATHVKRKPRPKD